VIVDLNSFESYHDQRIVPVRLAFQGPDGSIHEEPWYDLSDEGEYLDPVEYDFDTIAPDVTPSEAQLSEFYHLSNSDFTETAIRIPSEGKIDAFSFNERPYLRKIYDTDAKKVLFVSGRQCEKSTSLGNRTLGYCCLNNAFKALFVAPSAFQAKVFSNDRIAEPIEMSPTVQAYTNTKLTNAVFHKRFINYSSIRIRYAYLNADRVRGIRADLVEVDEIQDILVDNLPVIEECASHSDFKLFLYAGTPKSTDNTLEHYWHKFSTQNEWAVPCEACGAAKDKSTWFWNILREKNIGKRGLICSRCRRSINPYHPDATWASLNPINNNNKERVTFEGYRLPQLMVPWILKEWDQILTKQEQYSRARFLNEVVGISHDSGVRPITKAQLKACCNPELRLGDFEHFHSMLRDKDIFAGIDWGTSENSYTVIALGAYMGTGKFTIFWIHRFVGASADPDVQIVEIKYILNKFKATMAGADYGGGFDRNHALMQVFGPEKYFKYQYNPTQKKAKIYFDDGLGRFMVHRTEVMTDIFRAMVQKKIELPCWDDFIDPYGSDILNIFSEYNERLRQMEYKHAPGTTDDAHHAILYCALASMIRYPRPDILTSRKQDFADQPTRRKGLAT